MISEDVVASIALHALNDIEGFAGMATKPGSDIIDMIGKKNWGKGIKVTVTENESLVIDCNVFLAYGHSVVTVANNIQNAMTSALEGTTGTKVEAVNVNVCGIIRK